MSEFDNINGIYAKDATLREGIATLRNTVTSQTIKPLTVTQNGTYTADPSEGTYGYSPITVDVQEQPWQPLEDGYSNFWFELTDDTLSPWLNFSAKNNDATIDWGDGSGEVALDTLTPTHTYSKAGRYVVKVKGVTGIAAMLSAATFLPDYATVLKNVELNNEITTLTGNAFWRCFHLENIGGNATISSIVAGTTGYTPSLKSFTPIINTQNVQSCFYMSFSLRKIIFGESVESIANNTLYACYSLTELHMRATVPPTLNGASILTGLPTNWLCYVPVGTGETYKAAEGWSTYADHILEEGQTPNRAMLSKMTVKDDADTDEEMR